jgi:hypothetical protein
VKGGWQIPGSGVNTSVPWQGELPTEQGELPTEQGELPTEQGELPTEQGELPTDKESCRLTRRVPD